MYTAENLLKLYWQYTESLLRPLKFNWDFTQVLVTDFGLKPSLIYDMTNSHFWCQDCISYGLCPFTPDLDLVLDHFRPLER